MVNIVDYMVMGTKIRDESIGEEVPLEPLGRHLINLFSLFERELFDEIHKTIEFSSIGSTDHNILRCLGERGRSVNEISGMTGTTKQAVSKAVSSLEARGFLRRRANATDGRAQVVEFTAKGMRLFKAGVVTVGKIEKRYERILGAEEFVRVKRALASLTESYSEKVRLK